jgi:TolB protein
MISIRPSSFVLRFTCVVLVTTICLGHAGLANSAGPDRLTSDGKRKLSPVFTADGAAIVYSVHEEPTLVALVRLNLADGTQEKVHPVAAAHQFDAAYSPDGRYHCFAMSATSPQMVLVIEDLQQGTEAQFRPQGGRSAVRRPSIAPDGSRVAFGISADGGHQIASVDMAGGDFRKLTETAGWSIHPAYSPDGRRIAFSSSRAGDFEIYVMNADGSGVRRLTESPYRDMRPAWSPDGSQIAFTTARDGNYEIYCMDADGSHVRNITRHLESDDFPTWHPDGKHVVTVSLRHGKFDLYLFDVPQGSDSAR